MQKGNEMHHLDRFRRESPGLYWLIIAALFLAGLWPVGLFLIISGGIRDSGQETEAVREKKREPADPLSHREENTGEKMNMTGRTISATGSGKSKRIMKRSFSRFLIAAGGFFTVVFAIGGLNNLFFRLPEDPFLAFRDSYIPFIFTGLSAFVMMKGISGSRRAERYRTYLAILEGRDYADLREVADCSSFSLRTVRGDLRDMIDGNFFGADAWIDYSSGCVILTRAGGQAVRKRNETAEKSADSSAGSREKKRGRNGAAEGDAALPDERIMAEIRRIGDSIRNPDILEQTRKIGKITDQILRHERDSDLREKNGKLRSYLGYYLPEALKLLQRYSELEQEEIQGENIRSAMRKIEDVMEKVTSAFETRLDDLYQDDMMDIASDIAVMEQMMAKDGLAGNGMKLRPAASDAENRKNQKI